MSSLLLGIDRDPRIRNSVLKMLLVKRRFGTKKEGCLATVQVAYTVVPGRLSYRVSRGSHFAGRREHARIGARAISLVPRKLRKLRLQKTIIVRRNEVGVVEWG